jgi:transposase
MPSAYSPDLRQKAVEAIDRGVRKSEVITMLGISRDSLDRWLKRRTEQGSVQAAQGYQQGHSQRIVDWQKFRAFVQEHGDKTQAEMAQLWEGGCSQRTICRALAYIGFTRKKKHMGIENVMKSNVPHS